MRTPFSLPVSAVTSLAPDLALEFFRRLLWAEAAQVGVGKHLIHVPQCINVGDGGIDAFIENATPTDDALIPRGTTGFQIKSSDLTPQVCKKELHVGQKLDKPLKPEVKKILDQAGSYVLVLFADIPNSKKIARETAVKAELQRLGYPQAKVRLYTASQLVGFAEKYVSLVTWLQHDVGQCEPYSSWSERQDIKSPRQFVFDEPRQKWADEVRAQLRNPGADCPIFRVAGLSGIGKTRLLHETLAPDDLKNRVIYVNADHFRSSDLYYFLQNDPSLSAIIVVDECDIQQHEEFVRAFAGRGSRLALFTLSSDIGSVPQPTKLFALTPMTQETLQQVLEGETPQLPADVIRRLCEFADGYPRIAVLLVQSYTATGGALHDYLKITDEALFNRLISGSADLTSDHFQRTKRVLTGLSLFRKVGYRGDAVDEAKWLASYLGVEWAGFQQIVREQKQRGIVQGEFYLYVTPFMLRVQLLKEWWESQGITPRNFEGIVASIPEKYRADMAKRFFDLIPYITTTEQGRAFTREILGTEGFFADGSLLKNELGANLFLRLAEADPVSALYCLKRTVGAWSQEALAQFTTGRREAVWALEGIAVWRSLFADAARILLRLGEAENETWANNASGVFVQLFSPARAPVAPTEAAPSERLPILKEALNSTAKEQRLLGLRACDEALKYGHFSRMVGAEHQGLRKEPQLWRPQPYAELYEAYRQVWQLLRDHLNTLPEDEQEQVVAVLLSRARELVVVPNLSDLVIETLYDLSLRPNIDRKNLLGTVVQTLRYDGKRLSPEVRTRLEAFRDELTGADFVSLLKRYVAVKLFEDEFDDEGNQIDQTQAHVQRLARQAVEEPALLQKELGWLVTTEAENGYAFGYELGRLDRQLALLSSLVAAQREARERPSILFLSGYFHALIEQDQVKWEEQLDQFAQDNQLAGWVPELTWRSGITDRAAERVLELAEKGIIKAEHFGMFAYGGVVPHLAENIFTRWIEFLLESANPDAIYIALSLFDSYYIYQKPPRTLPEELTLRVLTHPLLFTPSDAVRRDRVMDAHHWSDIGKRFVEQHPDKSLPIAAQILEHFGAEGTMASTLHSSAVVVLGEITRRFPEAIWNLVIQFLGPPIDLRAFELNHWLHGGDLFEQEAEGALSLIPSKVIWEWVDADVERRAWYVASFVPRLLFHGENEVCLAREVLIRYGDQEDVRRNLMANFSTEGWTGYASAHYQAKKERLLKFREDEGNEKIRRWIDEYVVEIDKSIGREKLREEKGDF